MSVIINLRGDLNGVTVPGSFLAVVTALNVAAANGMKLAIIGSEDQPVAINIANINTIQEVDSDSFFG